MKLVKIDYGTETRALETITPIGKSYFEVECPFCGTRNLVYYRNFARGVRCRLASCRAMLSQPLHTATRDMLPENETVIVHDGLRTGVAVAAQNGGRK